MPLSVLLLMLSCGWKASGQQTGQDYYFRNAGQAQQQSQFLGYQQHQSPQQYSGFFPASGSGGYSTYTATAPSGYQGAPAEDPAQYFPSQPSPYQLPPRSTSAAQFQSFPSSTRLSEQPVFHTNQHLPQPFQTLPAQTHRFPFDIQVVPESHRFTDVQAAKPSYQTQSSYIGIQNIQENENGRTTQSYLNVQHPQGLVDQLTPISEQRWQQQVNPSPPIISDRRPQQPSVATQSTERPEDISLNGYIDQNLRLEEGARTNPPESAKPEGRLRRKPGTRVQPISMESNLFRTTTPEDTSRSLRTRYKNFHSDTYVRPTTYSPSTTTDPPRVRNWFVTTPRPQRERFTSPTTPDFNGDFGRPLFTKKVIQSGGKSRLSIPRSTTQAPLHYIYNKGISASEEDKSDYDYAISHEHSTEIVAVPDNETHTNLNNENSETNLNHEKKQIYNPVEPYKRTTASHKENDRERVSPFLARGNRINLQTSPSRLLGIEKVINEKTQEFDSGDPKDIREKENSNVRLQSKITVNKIGEEKKNTSFDVVRMNVDPTLVAEDNFKGFVDSVLIDATQKPALSQEKEMSGISVSMHSTITAKKPETTTNVPEDLVSVVTRTSISNSSASTSPPELTSIDQVNAPPSTRDPDAELPTESWVIVASVQTSRSVSGARFLPSEILKQDEITQPLVPKTKLKDSEVKLNRTSGNNTDESYFASSEETTSASLITQNTMLSSSHSADPVNTSSVSTESIIDKLDRVQSELSSGILSGGFRPNGNKLELDVLPEMTSDKNLGTATTNTPTMDTPSTLRATSPSSTIPTTTNAPVSTIEESTSIRSTEGPPPVIIRKFVPSARRTTPKPTVIPKKSLFDSIQYDDLTGLLPPGFKPRISNRKFSTTTTIPPTKNPDAEMLGDQAANNTSREGSGRSTSTGSKNKIQFEGNSALLPPGFKTENKTEKPLSIEAILGKIKFEEADSLLPLDFKPKQNSSSNTPKKMPEIKFDIPSNLLPPGYKLPKEIVGIANPTNELSTPNQPNSTESSIDLSTSIHSLLSKIQFKETASLLPPGFKLQEDNQTISEKSETTTTSGLKVVFPSRPGGGRKPLPRGNGSSVKAAGGLAPVKINKGWPIRASTEFTGWPTPSTTPISIEEILARAKAAASTTTTPSTTTTSTTTTTTTTTTTPRPTTPGICSEDCNIAGTIKLVGGAKWVPELLDHNTKEWQDLANGVQQQLEAIYSSSESLSRWYKKITIDAFSEGSILVDYFVELSELGRTVNTADMKRLFHESVLRSTANDFSISGETNLGVINRTDQYRLGKFILDPKYTDFLVLPTQVVPTVGLAEEDNLLPQWAIAVIVIGLASLLFVIIFGVTVLVNRHKSAKKKQPVALTEDMLNELNKNHMGGIDNYGADDLYNMEDVWNDKPVKKMRRSSGSLQENSMANLYDSWRSEWNGYYYSAYYGNGNGGSSTSGYARRRSDYDTNF